MSSFSHNLTLAFSYFAFATITMVFTRKYLPKTISERSRIRVVLTLHDIITVLFYTYKYLQYGIILNGKHQYWQEFTIITLSAQYIAHLAVTYNFNCMTINDLVHHLITAGLVSLGIAEDIIQFTAFTNYVFQLTHPGFGVRIFLKEFNMNYTATYEINEVCYFVGYLLSRLIGGVFLLKSFYELKVSNAAFLMALGLLGYVIYHSSKMIPYLMAIYFKYRERKMKGIKYFWLSENPHVKYLSYYLK